MGGVLIRMTLLPATPTFLLFHIFIGVYGSLTGLLPNPNTHEDAVTIFLAVRMMNSTEDDVKQCGKDLTVAREALGAARAKVDAQVKEVFDSEKRVGSLKEHDRTLERRVDEWVHKITAHRNQIESLELLVRDFTDKVKTDEGRIRGSRERVMDRVKIIRDKEVEHKAAIHSTKITQQALNRLKSWPDIDQWRLQDEQEKLQRELQHHVESHEDIQSRVADVNRQLEEIEAQIKSWEQNKQILGGILTYLDWSEKMLEDGKKVYKQEEKELGSLDELIDQRRADYVKSKKELVESREQYGKSIKTVIASQEKQIDALDKHSKSQAQQIGVKHDEDMKKQEDKNKEQMQKMEEVHADRVDDMKDRLEDTVTNLRKQMTVKEKKMKENHDKTVKNQDTANKEMLKAKEKHVDAMKQWHDAEMEGVKEKNKRLVDSMKEQQETHKETMEDHTHHIDEMRSANSATIDAMHKAQGDQIEASTDMQTKQMKAMGEAHEDQLKALRDQHDEQVETLHDHHESVNEDNREMHEDHVKDMQKSQSDSIRQLEGQIAIREDDIAERDRKLGELIRLQNDALKEHHDQMAFNDLAADKEVEQLRHQMEQQMSQREIQIRSLMDKQNLEIATRDSDIGVMEKMMAHFQELSNSRDKSVQELAKNLNNFKGAQDSMQKNWNYMHSETVDVLKDAIQKGETTMNTMKDAFTTTRGKLCNCLKREDALDGAVQGLTGTVTDIKGQVGQLQSSLHGTAQDISGKVEVLHRDLYDKVASLKGDIKDAVGDVKDLHTNLGKNVDDVKGSVNAVTSDMNNAANGLHGSIDGAVRKLDDAINENRRELAKTVTGSTGGMEQHVTGSVDAAVDDISQHVTSHLKDLHGDMQNHVSQVVGEHAADVQKDLHNSANTVKDNMKDQVAESNEDLTKHVAKSVGNSSASLQDQLSGHKEEMVAGQAGALKNIKKQISGQVGELRKQIAGQYGSLNGSVGDVDKLVTGVSEQVGAVDKQVQSVNGAVGQVAKHVTGVKGDVGELRENVQSTDEAVDTLNSRYTSDTTAQRVNAVRNGNRWTYGYGKTPYGYAYPKGVQNGEAFPPEAPIYAPISDAQRFQASLDYLSKSLNQAIHGGVTQYAGSAHPAGSVNPPTPMGVMSPLSSKEPAAFHQPQAQPVPQVIQFGADSAAEVEKLVGSQAQAAATMQATSVKTEKELPATSAPQGSQDSTSTKPPAGFGKTVQRLVNSIKKARSETQ